MVYRRIRILVWLVVPPLLATFAIGSSARPGARNDLQPTLRIVTPGVSEIVTEDITADVAQVLHLHQGQGVLISDILPSQLRPGDVILSVNGNPVRCEVELNTLLSQAEPGRPLVLEILRDGETQTVTVQPAIETVTGPPSAETRGIQVASLSTQSGVMVTDVRIGTPASSVGLQKGDIILDVDSHPVHSSDEFLEFMKQLSDKDATFNVRQQDGHPGVFIIPVQP